MTGSQSAAGLQRAVDFGVCLVFFSSSFPILIFPRRNPCLTMSSSSVKEPDLAAVAPDGDE